MDKRNFVIPQEWYEWRNTISSKEWWKLIKMGVSLVFENEDTDPVSIDNPVIRSYWSDMRKVLKPHNYEISNIKEKDGVMNVPDCIEMFETIPVSVRKMFLELTQKNISKNQIIREMDTVAGVYLYKFYTKVEKENFFFVVASAPSEIRKKAIAGDCGELTEYFKNTMNKVLIVENNEKVLSEMETIIQSDDEPLELNTKHSTIELLTQFA